MKNNLITWKTQCFFLLQNCGTLETIQKSYITKWKLLLFIIQSRSTVYTVSNAIKCKCSECFVFCQRLLLLFVLTFILVALGYVKDKQKHLIPLVTKAMHCLQWHIGLYTCNPYWYHLPQPQHILSLQEWRCGHGAFCLLVTLLSFNRALPALIYTIFEQKLLSFPLGKMVWRLWYRVQNVYPLLRKIRLNFLHRPQCNI